MQLIEESALYKACLNNVENEDQVYVIASNEENAIVVTHVATFMRLKSEKEQVYVTVTRGASVDAEMAAVSFM